MEPRGTHILAEYAGCDPAVLDDVDTLVDLMHKAAKAAGATIIGHRAHAIQPNGKACILVLQESHLSIRTSPTNGYASADFFTCGDCRPKNAHTVIFDGLDAQSSELVEIERGLSQMPMMRVLGHRPTTRVEVDCRTQHLPPTICVKQSPGRGLGLYSTRALSKGELIYETQVRLVNFDTEYVLQTDVGNSVQSADDLGTELTIPVLQTFSDEMLTKIAMYYRLEDPSLIKLRHEMTEGGTLEVLITGFDGLMNHSKFANIKVNWPENCLSFKDGHPVWDIQILASKAIEANEELFWDYTEAPGVIIPSDWRP